MLWLPLELVNRCTLGDAIRSMLDKAKGYTLWEDIGKDKGEFGGGERIIGLEKVDVFFCMLCSILVINVGAD